MNVLPSRARRQLAARLALHSQQRADAEAADDEADSADLQGDADASSSPRHKASPFDDTNASSYHNPDSDEEPDPHSDPMSSSAFDSDDDNATDVPSSESLLVAPLAHAHPDNHSTDDISPQYSTSTSNPQPRESPNSPLRHHDDEHGMERQSLSPPNLNMRQLDLDDFANSPAADAMDDGMGMGMERRTSLEMAGEGEGDDEAADHHHRAATNHAAS